MLGIKGRQAQMSRRSGKGWEDTGSTHRSDGREAARLRALLTEGGRALPRRGKLDEGDFGKQARALNCLLQFGVLFTLEKVTVKNLSRNTQVAIIIYLQKLSHTLLMPTFLQGWLYSSILLFWISFGQLNMIQIFTLLL